MTLTIGMVTVDTQDAERLGGWWAEQLGTEVAQNHDGWFLVVPAGPVLMAFQKVEDPTPGKNRIHLDVRRDPDDADDADGTVARLRDLGATSLSAPGDLPWLVFADPSGNELCVLSPAGSGGAAT